VSPEDQPRPYVNPLLVRAAAYGWRLLVVAAVVVGALWLIGRLLVVVVPIFVALLVVRVLEPPAAALRRRGWRPGLAALVVFASALVGVAVVVALLVPPITNEFSDLRPTIEDAIDDVETWIVEDGPFDLTRDQVADYEDRLVERGRDYLANNGLQGRASLLLEIPAGMLLAFFLSFFALKDGAGAVGRLLERLPEPRRRRWRAIGESAWTTLGGYLRGAALLGLLEALVIGLTLWLVGGDLVIPVMVLTFAAAFVPIIGAITAGVVAVLVALVAAGPVGALVVGGVALLVQQLDNDLLAPVIYGRNVEIHPVVILVSIVAGGALFGIVGTLFAVPVVAVALNAWTTDRAGAAAARIVDPPDEGRDEQGGRTA
jgi:predicted PurR-regulated permease PerM